ncbi:MAG: nitrate- and nitrite sensing domain-containing protein, partial [Steroidobacteraceae bacterium]
MRRRKIPIDASGTDTPALRFLRSAQSCRARDLAQLSILGDLVKILSELIHALQKERGASSIYLGSNGTVFADRLCARAADSRGLEERMRSHFDRLDEKLAPMNCSARLYTRVAFALRALDSLPLLRRQVSALALAPQDAVQTFTQVIRLLLAVGFEAADIAADPAVSRALIALVYFAQGKEYAGQERATGGAALSRHRIEATDQTRLQQLQAAQDQAFKAFTDFADPPHARAFLELCGGADAAQLAR